MFKSMRSLAVGLVIGLGAGVTTSVASAAIPATGGVISGCMNAADASGQHTITLLDTAQAAVCQAGQTLVTWNQTGPKGDPGTSATIKTDPIPAGNATCPTGGQSLIVENNGVPVSGKWPAVCNGAAGAQGATGAQGPQGATGPQGPTGPAGTASIGYRTVALTDTVPPVHDTVEVLLCPDNTVPISGGVIATGLAQEPSSLNNIVFSGQVDAHSWMIKWTNPTPITYNMTFQAVCINPS